MGNLDTQAELGGFVSYAILPALAVNASLRAGIGDRKGVRLDLGISHGFQLAAGWRLRLSAGTTFANKDTLQAYFGVTPAQSLTSGYTVYTPKAGIEDVRVGASLSYALAPRTTMTAGLTARTLQSQAKDSPLVRKASSVSGLLGLGYAF
jgi:outer membrane scaffolding protein for murein synthesis (MipA/OmpV family)